jgi:hypothetical protein
MLKELYTHDWKIEQWNLLELLQEGGEEGWGERIRRGEFDQGTSYVWKYHNETLLDNSYMLTNVQKQLRYFELKKYIPEEKMPLIQSSRQFIPNWSYSVKSQLTKLPVGSDDVYQLYGSINPGYLYTIECPRAFDT